MKKLLLLLLIVPMISFGQNNINYQAIVSNSSGTVISSQSIGVKLSVIYTNANSGAVYSETHTTTTTSSGLINIKLGSGGTASGTFANIDWSTSAIYLKSEVNIGSGYVNMGTQQIEAVPVALYAKNVNLLDANNTIAIGGVVSATNSVAIGKDALAANTSGANNTAIGKDALKANTTGSYNTTNGNSTLYSNTTGGNNTANGFRALRRNTTGNNNTANGYWSLEYNTTGDGNTANGMMALYSNSSGDSNSANGYQALWSNTTGSYNTANGNVALNNNTTGNNNVANGYAALYNNTTGASNVGVGQSTLETNTTGNNNTAIGSFANVGSNNLTNATAIGYGASVSASNTIQLGNSSVALVKTSGTISATAFVGNGSGLTNISSSGSSPSDRRLKKDITNTKYGLETILKLVPVDYLLKSNNLSQIGFIAQDLKPIVPEAVNGTEGDIEKGETLGITYTTLIPILTKAIQEQEKNIQELKKENEDLKKRIDALENK